MKMIIFLTLVLLNPDLSCLYKQCTNQLASEEANWSGSLLFAIKYVNIYINNMDQVIWLAEN